MKTDWALISKCYPTNSNGKQNTDGGVLIKEVRAEWMLARRKAKTGEDASREIETTPQDGNRTLQLTTDLILKPEALADGEADKLLTAGTISEMSQLSGTQTLNQENGTLLLRVETNTMTGIPFLKALADGEVANPLITGITKETRPEDGTKTVKPADGIKRITSASSLTLAPEAMEDMTTPTRVAVAPN